MTADRDDLAAILAKHYRLVRRANIARQECICGEWSMTNRSETFAEEAHRAHVAQMVLESDWLRDVKADAWKEGADTVYEDWSEAEGPWFDDVEDTFPNPHRADRVDAEDGGR